MTEKIRLLLADDQALVRGALAALLDLERDIEVVSQVQKRNTWAMAGWKSTPRCASERCR